MLEQSDRIVRFIYCQSTHFVFSGQQINAALQVPLTHKFSTFCAFSGIILMDFCCQYTYTDTKNPVFDSYYYLVFTKSNIAGINQQGTKQKKFGPSETIRGAMSFIYMFVMYNCLDASRLLFSHQIVFSKTGSSAIQYSKFSHSSSDFDFEEYSLNLPQHKANVDIAFLEWFIGFTEGDGSFGFTDRPSFTINQADENVLSYIRTTLGFGTVRRYTEERSVTKKAQKKDRTKETETESVTDARYSVTAADDIKRLITLFNGNSYLTKVHARFSEWVVCYNKTYNTNIKVLPCKDPDTLTLKSHWLAGFWDAEGGFSAYVSKQANRSTNCRLYCRAYVSQKGEYALFEKITKLFCTGKVVVVNSNEQYYRVEASSIKSLNIVREYFNNHKLHSKKHIVYSVWLKIVNLYLLKQHFNNMDKLKQRCERLQKLNAAFTELRTVDYLFEYMEKLYAEDNDSDLS
uniref:Putative LAGLIDADG homing endonuclease n=1 Tax=Hafniomonas laevis TaxID=436124 RepID=A0A0S2LP01_9CHLO|nr:putative LAGLIDADG homing endonuclease [Hafniomonas laevis]ALO63095.1 putative LAGLIDADG homing endonuclease [Hafniomonas laevis]